MSILLAVLLIIGGTILVGLAIMGYINNVLSFADRVNELTGRKPKPLTEESARRLLEEYISTTRSKAPVAEPDPEVLARYATERTVSLLQEAIELQRQHKEREAIERLLTAYDMELPPHVKAQIHQLAGNGLFRLSEYEQAKHHFENVIENSLEAANKVGEGAGLTGLGMVSILQSRFDEADDFLSKARQIYQDLDDKARSAAVAGNQSVLCFSRGDLAGAERFAREAIDISEDLDDPVITANAYSNLGAMYQGRGMLKEARESFERALSLHRDVRDRAGEASDLANIGVVLRHQNQPNLATQCLSDAQQIFEEIEDLTGQADCHANLSNIRNDADDLPSAHDHLEKVLDLRRRVGDRRGEADALGNLGVNLVRSGEPRAAETKFREALAIDQAIGNLRGEARRLGYLGSILDDLKKPGAEETLSEAVDAYRKIGDVLGEAEVLRNLAVVVNRRGDRAGACRLLKEALDVFRSKEAASGIASVSQALRALNCPED